MDRRRRPIGVNRRTNQACRTVPVSRQKPTFPIVPTDPCCTCVLDVFRLESAGTQPLGVALSGMLRSTSKKPLGPLQQYCQCSRHFVFLLATVWMVLVKHQPCQPMEAHGIEQRISQGLPCTSSVYYLLFIPIIKYAHFPETTCHSSDRKIPGLFSRKEQQRRRPCSRSIPPHCTCGRIMKRPTGHGRGSVSAFANDRDPGRKRYPDTRDAGTGHPCFNRAGDRKTARFGGRPRATATLQASKRLG